MGPLPFCFLLSPAAWPRPRPPSSTPTHKHSLVLVAWLPCSFCCSWQSLRCACVCVRCYCNVVAENIHKKGWHCEGCLVSYEISIVSCSTPYVLPSKGILVQSSIISYVSCNVDSFPNFNNSSRWASCEFQVRLLVAIPAAPAPAQKVHLRPGHFADC